MKVKGVHYTTVLVAALLAGCADQGPTSPVPAPFERGLASVETGDDERMMSFMGGGIEDVMAGDELASTMSTLSAGDARFTSIDVPGAVATRAFGINTTGDIVGSYTDATGTHGFLLREGEFSRISYPGAIATEAWGINPQGDIVGRYRAAGDPRTFGFLLSEGVFSDISVPGHLHTLPIKISPSRDIAGCFHDTNFLVDMRGYIQRRGQVTSFERLPSTMHNGVTPGGGTIAGIFFETAALVHGYVLERGEYRQFDVPGATFTQAWDVSPTGTVVGYFHPGASRGFVIDARAIDADGPEADDFTVIHLSGAQWTRIFGINPQGRLVGSYADAIGRVHGFLM